MDQVSPEQFRNQLENIHAEVRQRVETVPEENRDETVHREAIHEVIGDRLGKVGEQQSVQRNAVSIDPTVVAQVNALVEEAMTKDVDGAIDKARKSNNPAVIDAFHDALVGRLFEHLVSEGKLKNLAR